MTTLSRVRFTRENPPVMATPRRPLPGHKNPALIQRDNSGMKALIFLSLSYLACAADVPQGTHVLLRMMNTINTRTAAEGDQVYLQTATPIAANGQIIVPTGSYVQGVITHAKRSGKVTGRAELGIRLETLTLPGGKAYKIAPRLASADPNETGQKVDKDEDLIKQAPDKGRDAARIAILAGTGASIGGIASQSWGGAGIGAGAGGAVGLATTLLTRGKEVQLRQGSTLDVTFDHALVIE